jgi:uncharacterized membrane protein
MPNISPQKIAQSLGWFSIGLGLAEIAAPTAVANIVGVNGGSATKKTLRFYGARELAAGIGILSQSKPSAWLWGRVAGDVLDLSSLFKAMTSKENERGKTAAVTAAVLGVTAADVCCAMQLTRRNTGEPARVSAAITSSVIISSDPEKLYGFWRNFQHLPEIFDRLNSVEVLDGNRSHWKLEAGMGRTLEWDAEITEDQPNSRIAWRSLSSLLPHSGEVRFDPAAGKRGTKVTVKIWLGGMKGGLGKLLGLVPEQHVNIALHSLKQLLETGEVVKSDASIHRGMHPAQPPEQYPLTGEELGAAASA